MELAAQTLGRFTIAAAPASRHCSAHLNLLVPMVLAAAAAVAWLKDRELLGRVARGEQAALRTLYDACGSKALAIALRILRAKGEAEEVVQDTFVEVWKRAGEYDVQRGGATAWIATIARTRAIDRFRTRDSAARAARGQAQMAEVEPARNPAPLELAEARQDRERVAAALSELPAEQRQAIELAYFEGLTQREISERTGDPLGTVKTRMRLAMEKLSVRLGDDGSEP